MIEYVTMYILIVYNGIPFQYSQVIYMYIYRHWPTRTIFLSGIYEPINFPCHCPLLNYMVLLHFLAAWAPTGAESETLESSNLCSWNPAVQLDSDICLILRPTNMIITTGLCFTLFYFILLFGFFWPHQAKSAISPLCYLSVFCPMF